MSLAELLQCERSVDDSTGQPLVGEADCFVSYARSCRWSALLEAVGSIEGIEDQYLWIDMLCTDADQRAADRNHQLCHIERVISQCGCECCTMTLFLCRSSNSHPPQHRHGCCARHVGGAVGGDAHVVLLRTDGHGGSRQHC